MKYLLIFCFIVFSSCADTESKCGLNPLSANEKTWLIESLEKTTIGRHLLDGFIKKFKSYNHLYIVRDDKTYSFRIKNDGICVHLISTLPALEQIADFSHELKHSVDRPMDYFYKNKEEFIEGMIADQGGEIDAIIAECKVKYEFTGAWDAFCLSLMSSKSYKDIDRKKLYVAIKSGKIKTSLTDETYMQMLGKQWGH